jgi:dTDP-4-amino-4,6-dideoxygalactose transaminase
MSEIAAIVGKYQLKNLEGFVRRRNEIARYYDRTLWKTPEVSLFKVPANIRHSYYKYALRLSDGVDHEKLARILIEDAVETRTALLNGVPSLANTDSSPTARRSWRRWYDRSEVQISLSLREQWLSACWFEMGSASGPSVWMK